MTQVPKLILIVIAGTLLVLTSPGIAFADDADDIVTALGYPDYFQSVSHYAVAASIERVRKQKAPTDAKLQQFGGDLAKAVNDYRSTFLSQIATAFRSRFSAEELAQLLTFYASPLGKKVGAAQNGLQDELAKHSRDLGVLVGVTAAKLADQ